METTDDTLVGLVALVNFACEGVVDLLNKGSIHLKQ